MEDDDFQDLRNKIRSKMEVAKFFSGFVSLVFGVVLKDLVSEPANCTAATIAFLSFVASLAFSVATMFAYDRLLMPFRFWRKCPDIDFMQSKMVSAWRCLFLPAVCALFVGLVAIYIGFTNNLAIGIGSAIPLAIVFAIYRVVRVRF